MGKVKFSVCALIFNEEGKLLAVSRKNNKDDWGLPGGKVDGDETIEEAVVREVKEETGLDIKVSHFIFGNLTESKGYYCYTYFCNIIGGELHTPEKIAELGEGDIKWADWEDIEAGKFGGYNRHLHYVYDKAVDDAVKHIRKVISSNPLEMLMS